MTRLDPRGEVETILEVLPPALQEAVHRLVDQDALKSLIEIVMDLGRPAEARMIHGAIQLSERQVEHAEIEHVVATLGDFSDDNRAGIERTLHRISAIRNRRGDIIGLTLRVGRAIQGTIELLRDLIETGKNILFLGRPGIGKTTKLREVARVLADNLERRVIVIDTSNEIAGEGDIPHPAIGGARRMQVPRPDRQHGVMIEAVENHMPEVIIVDEIGTEAEAAAARTIAERGVQLIGTAHGTTLENLIMNPTVSDLVGGVHTVTLSDEEARRRKTPKTINERRAPPTFDIVVEMINRDEVIVYGDTAEAVDTILTGKAARGQTRTTKPSQPVTAPPPSRTAAPIRRIEPGGDRALIYLHGVSRDLAQRVLRDLRIDARVVSRVELADLVLALRSREGDSTMQEISELEAPPSVHFIKKNGTAPIRRALENVFHVLRGIDRAELADAVAEVEHAIQRALRENIEIELVPRAPALRKMQHRIISRYPLASASVGSEPYRHLIVYPPSYVRKSAA